MAQKKKKEKSITTRIIGALPNSSYWDRTDRIKALGQTPQCCGKPMSAEDDHGRFICFDCGSHTSL